MLVYRVDGREISSAGHGCVDSADGEYPRGRGGMLVYRVDGSEINSAGNSAGCADGEYISEWPSSFPTLPSLTLPFPTVGILPPPLR